MAFPNPDPELYERMLKREQHMSSIDEDLGPFIHSQGNRVCCKTILMAILQLLRKFCTKEFPEREVIELVRLMSMVKNFGEMVRMEIGRVELGLFGREDKAAVREERCAVDRAEAILDKFDILSEGVKQLHKWIMPWEFVGLNYNTEDIPMTTREAKVEEPLKVLEELGVPQAFSGLVHDEVLKRYARVAAKERAKVKSGR